MGCPHYGHLLTGLCKGRHPTLQDHARLAGGEALRLGLPRPAGRNGGSQGAGTSHAGPTSRTYGIGRFNDYCQASVLRYTNEWERYVTRQARWVDFSNDYKTMDLSYMESVMWAFGQLYKKGLLYEGYRVLPYCWECETPLSNFETPAGQFVPLPPGPRRDGRFRAGATA